MSKMQFRFSLREVVLLFLGMFISGVIIGVAFSRPWE